MRYAILLVLLLIGCSGPEEAPAIEAPELPIPSWDTDSSIAAISSRISEPNRKLVLSSVREGFEREAMLFQRRREAIHEMISFEEECLQEILTAPINPDDEESYIYYCANIRVKLELLRVELFHQKELDLIHKSMEKLIESLPHKEPGD